MSQQQQQQDDRSQLLRVFKIGPDDLEANRQGLLGARQRQRMVRSGYLQLLMAVALALGLVGLVLAIAERPFEPVQIIITLVLFTTLLVLGAVTCLRYSPTAGPENPSVPTLFDRRAGHYPRGQRVSTGTGCPRGVQGEQGEGADGWLGISDVGTGVRRRSPGPDGGACGAWPCWRRPRSRR